MNTEATQEVLLRGNVLANTTNSSSTLKQGCYEVTHLKHLHARTRTHARTHNTPEKCTIQITESVD